MGKQFMDLFVLVKAVLFPNFLQLILEHKFIATTAAFIGDGKSRFLATWLLLNCFRLNIKVMAQRL